MTIWPTVYKLLSDSRFGFRKNRSTILQLLTVMEEWTIALDNNKQVDTVYLDFRKAFDSMPHNRLIKKLEYYGIKSTLLQWFKNFHNGRQQRVVINGKTSNWTDLISGIPQESILGPVLIIFINDLPGVVGSVCRLFADDCKLYRNIESGANLRELQEGKWATSWQNQRSGMCAQRRLRSA